MMKSSILLWIFVGVCCCLAVVGSSQNPGLQVRITRKGFNYAALHMAAAIDLLEIQEHKISDDHEYVNHVNYSLTGIHVTGFTKPQINLKPQAGKGLTWQATGLDLSLHADFKYNNYEKILPISDHGSVDVSISGATLALSVSIGKDAGGRVSKTWSGCKCGIHHISLKFHGVTTSWLYRLSLFENLLQKEFQKIMCTDIKSFELFNEDLSEMPVTVGIAHKFLVDCRLLSPPTFTSAFMDTFHKGKVFWSAHKREAPFAAPAIPALTSSNKMVYFVASDYLVNTLGYVAHQHGVLKTNVTVKDLPSNKRSFLNTTCQGSFVDICLGKLIPQTGTKYPNSIAEMHMSSSRPPKMTISPSVISLNFTGDILFYARVTNGSVYFMFSVNMGLNTTFKASVKDGKLYSEIEKMTLRVNLTKSEIGKIDLQRLQTALDDTIMLNVKQINILVAEGFPLSEVPASRFTLTNTELTLAKDALILDPTLKKSHAFLSQRELAIAWYRKHYHAELTEKQTTQVLFRPFDNNLCS